MNPSPAAGRERRGTVGAIQGVDANRPSMQGVNVNAGCQALHISLKIPRFLDERAAFPCCGRGRPKLIPVESRR